MSVYKLNGTAVAGTNNALASLDVQVDGIINAMSMNINPNGMDALDDSFQAELSFGSTNTLTSNDVRSSLMTIGATQEFLTSGGGIGATFGSVSGVNIPVSAGERVFIHAVTDTGVSGEVTAYLYVDDGVDAKPQRRRR